MSTPSLPPTSSVKPESASACIAGPEVQMTLLQGNGVGDPQLEPGEIPASEIKQGAVDDSASNPFLKYHDGNLSQSPFACVAVTTSSVTPFNQSAPVAVHVTPPSMNSIQRRNHERLSSIITRLQNFDGSVTELLAVASVQQQLDVAFTDLDRAKNQLKDVFQQFELQGRISNRQCQKKNSATRDLTTASHRIAQLTKELWGLQRRASAASDAGI
ncbi:hypothetical protein GQX73_g10 [Xylaria multiplex]|uniref:Uncharacterized protein n=1 Tax=Xylaria multiplex TaxID=323545 RepID=A0A7C8MTP5_9PEZI|nr:hypothetical protein GQX73_g10 [Xylaria multiplex]